MESLSTIRETSCYDIFVVPGEKQTLKTKKLINIKGGTIEKVCLFEEGGDLLEREQKEQGEGCNTHTSVCSNNNNNYNNNNKQSIYPSTDYKDVKSKNSMQK